MEFRFIDNSAPIDRQSRKLIRSQVMKGKNLGKARPRRRRKTLKEPSPWLGPGLCNDVDTSCPPLEVIHVGENKAENDRDRFSEIRSSQPLSLRVVMSEPATGISTPHSLFAGTEYSYFAFPIRFTPSMRYLVHQFNSAVSEALYPREFCRRSRETRFPWFEYMIMNQAFLHCCLAMTASYVTLFRGHVDSTLETMQHFTQTLQLVNRDLSAPVPPADPTIAVVVSLVVQSNIAGSVHNARVHLDGLQRILALRPGGLASLPEFLSQKIARADVEAALLAGTTTRFSLEMTPPSSLGGATALALPSLLSQMSPSLQGVTREVLALCRIPDRADKLPPHQFQDIAISICQRLVDFVPLGGPRPPDPLDDVWQLGLLTFMATVLYRAAKLRVTYFGRLSRLLKLALTGNGNCDELAQDDGVLRLRFWLFFMYGISMLRGCEDQWLAAQISALAGELGVRSWEDARQVLDLFPWIDIVHDTPGRKLWDLAMPLLAAAETE